ncbi:MULTISPECIES: hypothetical protein [unclassified Mesorhizobium]|uniref:hypothetical protein n=1 Tax=unclassified Mesorhizobium TaxID=325217 RepID=UPI0012DDAC17|nr:hypothetical protein [Mesorhizobium sp. L2C085B000]
MPFRMDHLASSICGLPGFRAMPPFLKELLVVSGKTPKKSHNISLTGRQHWRDIDGVTASELPREGDGRAAIHGPDRLARPSGFELAQKFL